MTDDLDALQAALGHRFADPALLAAAVTHPSVAGTSRGATHYERLEFLGDRVLGLVVAELLYRHFPKEREGDMGKRFANLVRREAVAEVAGTLGLGAHLRLSPGEDEAGGRENPANLANACEAVFGAIYLDGGFQAVAPVLQRLWTPLLSRAAAPPQDPKTQLQEWAQRRGKPLPQYRALGRSGPDHDPRFDVEVAVVGHPPAAGSGASKRAAEKEAASALLAALGVKRND
ncbi:MAG TPA: ribonuclease III [Alphaproteobacteria bacterium]|nr:ribonuclease III [Alphaproteobacteria bacterium]